MKKDFRSLIKEILDERTEAMPQMNMDSPFTREMLSKELETKIKSKTIKNKHLTIMNLIS